ncbi:MAG: protein-L-isoaspartate(D-aspartate) O-methyltransferase [Pseudomonadales bacterium]
MSQPLRGHRTPAWIAGAVLAGTLIATPAAGAEADATAEPRAALVREIEAEVAYLAPQLGFDRLQPAVVDAVRRTPRHEFVPEALQAHAYENRPLPIGSGQTISQPLIVALMTHLLDVQAGATVYELGTGSGYQAAVLAEMGVNVYSVEIVEPLAERARQTLAALGYARAHVRAGDGYLGWPDAAPFDAVIITAALEHVPAPLTEQLRPGGRLVMPIGQRSGAQQLAVFIKAPDGTLQRRDVLTVMFVPVTGPSVDR